MMVRVTASTAECGEGLEQNKGSNSNAKKSDTAV